MISLSGIIAGITAIIIIVTGYTTMYSCIKRGKHDEAPLLVVAGLLLGSMGSLYLGTVVSFFHLLITGTNLSTVWVGRLCYMWAPIAIVLGVYVGFMIIKKEYAKKMAIFYLLFAPVYYYGLFFDAERNIDSAIPMNGGVGLIDINLIGYVQIITAFFILSTGLVMISGFLWLASQSAGAVRKKAHLLAAGYFLFVICATMDALFDYSAFIVIIRLFMATAYVLLYKGFATINH